jgi:hypothetical protein
MHILRATTADFSDCTRLQSDVLFVMPYIDLPMAKRAAAQMSTRANAPGHMLLVEDQHGWGFIRIVNHVFQLTHSAMFGYVAQDAFAGRQWLSLALAALQPPEKNLFGFNDGKWYGAFASFGLAKRAWASQSYPKGCFFEPGYRSHFADVELSLLAISQGCYIHDPRSLLVEVDWNKDSAPVNAQDHAHYRSRVADGFEGRVIQPFLLNMVA